MTPGSEAMDAPAPVDVVTFGVWRFDRRLGRLFRQKGPGDWVPVAIGSRAQDILGVMLQDPGALVSKDVLVDAVWPGIAVEPNNLTVQMTALRRVLGDGSGEASYIQTVPGRGYRFVCPVAHGDTAILAPDQDGARPQNAPSSGTIAAPDSPQTVQPVASGPSMWPWRDRQLTGYMAGTILVLLVLGIVWHGVRFSPTPPPRLSLVVMPFRNAGDNPQDDILAEAITNDLTSDMTLAWAPRTISQEAARPYKAQGASPQRVGAELGVRYMLTGDVLRLGDVVHVNAQLVSTETGAQLWSDRFDTPGTDLGAAQDMAVRRIGAALPMEMTAIEAARSQRERPDNPDAVDLLLQARLLRLQPPNPQRVSDALALYERAFKLDPSSTLVKIELADALLDNEDITPQGRKTVLLRTAALLDSARAQQPTAELVQLVTLEWLSWQDERCAETIEAARHFIEIDPRAPQSYRWLGWCLIKTGRAEEAIPILEKAILLGPRDPLLSHDDRNLAYALLLLGHYDAAIEWAERALALNPEDSRYQRARLERWIAAAYALTGRLDDARRTLAQANGIWPYRTVRGVSAGDYAGTAYAAQVAHLRDGLRLAGMRDHADAEADFGIKPDGTIRQWTVGPTPIAIQGVTTIRAADLVRLLADRKPAVVDTLRSFTGQSIPGAIGLRYVGEGGNLSDAAQDHLRSKMLALTNGDLATPVIAVGWSSETFDGSNLALRLAALGYKNVYWYRGGRQDWEVQGLPEANLPVQDW